MKTMGFLKLNCADCGRPLKVNEQPYCADCVMRRAEIPSKGEEPNRDQMAEGAPDA